MYWISIESVFEKRYVFIPICQANHWNLVILCNLDHSVNTARSPCILLLDSLHGADPQHLETEIRHFVIDIYKNEGREGYDDIAFKVPKVPQQKDGTKCGHYVLYYIYKFILSCPEHFNVEEDYPGFMDESWFSGSDVQQFFESIASDSNEEIENEEIEEDDGAEEKADLEKGTPRANDPFEGSDALRALVIYTPESSQEMLKTMQPPVEIVYQNETHKGDYVSFINESVFERKKTKAPRRSNMKVRAIKTPLSLRGAKADEPEVIAVSDVGKGKKPIEMEEKGKPTPAAKKKGKSSTIINDDDDSDFERGTALPKKRKARVQGSQKNVKKPKKDVVNANSSEDPKKVNLRAYPSTFTAVVEGMSVAQKEWVKEAGFGHLLSFSMGANHSRRFWQ